MRDLNNISTKEDQNSAVAYVKLLLNELLQSGLDPISTEPKLLRQTRVLNGLMLTALTLCLPLGAFWTLLASPLFVPVYLLAFIAWALLIALLRKTKRVILVGRIAVCVLFALCTASVILLGSRESNILAWYMLMPLAAAVCVGRNDLWFWGVIATLTPALMYFFPELGAEASSNLGTETKRQLAGIVLALGGLIASILTSIWITHHEELAHRLDESASRLKKEAEAQRLLVTTAMLASGEAELGKGARRLLEHLAQADWVLSVAFWDTRGDGQPKSPLCWVPETALYLPSAVVAKTIRTGERANVSHADSNQHSVCYPIRDGNDVVGVLEFNADADRSPAQEEGWLVQQIAIQLGHIAERERTARIIQKEARFDSLTNLPNRRAFRDTLEQALKSAEHNGDRIGLLFIDLNDFKRINDSLGHAAGDEVLQVVARRLQQAVRESDSQRSENGAVGDTISRIGGDEFTLVLQKLPSPDAASIAAERILAALASPVRLSGQQFKVGASIGIAVFPDDAERADVLISSADAAMYAAKRRGGRGYLRYEVTEDAIDTLKFEADIRRALEECELEMHYQPVFNCQNRQPVGAEALIRWLHPDKGWISPAEFIPLAEKLGLIHDIGRFQFETALQWFAESRTRLPDNFRLALNLSPMQIENPEFANWLVQRLKDSGLPLALLELEITETALLADTPEIRSNLANLTELGLCITLDDFGTGQSSLSLLKRFPIGKLKIDRSFVNGLPERSEDIAIVGAVLSLAQALLIPVVAEGVEREEQRLFLSRRKCEFMQGFLLARPMPGEQLVIELDREQSRSPVAGEC